jgi:ABC-2 type transport system permease protein
MRVFFTLVRRELSCFFGSLTGYIMLGAVTFLIGLCSVQLIDGLAAEASDAPFTEAFYKTWFFWLIVLLASPLITMRSYAHEMATGTFETLITTPVRDIQVVLAKFTGALLMHCILWLPLLVVMAIIQHFAQDTAGFAVGTVASTYLGLLLLGGLFMSLGCCASSLTRSQIVAAMLSLALGMVIFLLSYHSFVTPLASGWAAQCLRQMSIIEHMQDFVRGTIDTRHVVFYVSSTVFFLFLTLKSIESRHWK